MFASDPSSRRTPWLERALAAAVAGLCFGAYWATHGTGPFWQDSGLFLAALKTGGGLLPPGYPIYLLLGRPFVAAFQAVLPSRSFAEAGNTFSAVWAALAAGLICLSILTILRPGYGFFRPPATLARRRGGAAESEPARARPGLDAAAFAAAALGGLLAGLSYSLWFQALTAEAYALNAFFAALELLLVFRLAAHGPLGPEPAKAQRRLVLALLVTHGLSFGNHPSTVVFLPALAWLAWTQRAVFGNRRLVGLAIGAYAASALAPYAYLPWAAAAHPTNRFGHVARLPGLLQHVTGTQWTGQAESFAFSFDRFQRFPGQAWEELFVVGLLGLGLGALRLWRERRALLVFLVAFALPAWLLPMLYKRGGEYDFWLLPLSMAGFVVAGVGIRRLLETAAGPWRSPAARLAAGALVALLALVPPLWVNAPLVNRAGYFVPEDFGRNLLRSLVPGAVLLASSDQENALTYYLQAVERFRTDVVRIDVGVLETPWHPDLLRRSYPDLAVPTPPQGGPRWTASDWVSALIQANAGRRAIYLSGAPPVPPPQGTSWVPAGGLVELAPRVESGIDPRDWAYLYRNPSPFDRPARSHAPELLPDGTVRREPYTEQVRRFHVQAFKNLGDFCLDEGRFPEAAAGYARALALDPSLDHPGILFGLGKALFLADRNELARLYLERVGGRLDAGRAAEASLYLGQIHASRGESALASEYFEAVRRTAPELWAQIESSKRRAPTAPSPRP